MAKRTVPITSRRKPESRWRAANFARIAPRSAPTTSETKPIGAWPEAWISDASQPIAMAATTPATDQINMAMSRGAFERLLEVGDQVVRIFDAAGEADHVVRDAIGAAVLRRALIITHHEWLLDQRLDAAEARRDPRNKNGIDNVGRSAPIGIFHEERHQAAEAAHLPACDVMVSVRREARVINFFDARM